MTNFIDNTIKKIKDAFETYYNYQTPCYCIQNAGTFFVLIQFLRKHKLKWEIIENQVNLHPQLQLNNFYYDEYKNKIFYYCKKEYPNYNNSKISRYFVKVYVNPEQIKNTYFNIISNEDIQEIYKILQEKNLDNYIPSINNYIYRLCFLLKYEKINIKEFFDRIEKNLPEKDKENSFFQTIAKEITPIAPLIADKIDFKHFLYSLYCPHCLVKHFPCFKKIFKNELLNKFIYSCAACGKIYYVGHMIFVEKTKMYYCKNCFKKIFKTI